MKKKGYILVALLLIIPYVSGCALKAGSKDTSKGNVNLLVAAASSLEYVLKDKLIPEFEKQNPGITVEGTFDSSGKLQTQIEEGIDADIFFSAATKQMDVLSEEGFISKKNQSRFIDE